MLNNRQAGRRRGRGNQRPQGNSGGRGAEQGNRIDNRARGNAPQMLEKYSTLARDAQQQGDRVMTEYYLQFADHYFRVVADNRARMEESRPPREEGVRDDNAREDGYREDGNRAENGRDDWQAEDSNGGEPGERPDTDNGDDRYQNGDRQQQARPQRDRYEQNRPDQNRSDQNRPTQNRDGQNRDAPRRNDYRRDEGSSALRSSEPREPRPPREPHPPREPRFETVAQNEGNVRPAPRQPDLIDADEAPAPRPRRARTPQIEPESNGFDVSILPPAISAPEAEEKPAPKPRMRVKRVATETSAEG